MLINRTRTVPPPDPQLRCLDPLVGTWRTQHRRRTPPFSAPASLSPAETYHWLDGGYFLVQTYETVFGNESAQRGINYWGYDADAERFRIIFFSNNGPFTEDGNRYEGRVEAGVLTFRGPACFEHALDDEGRIALNDDGTYTVDWWLQDQRPLAALDDELLQQVLRGDCNVPNVRSTVDDEATTETTRQTRRRGLRRSCSTCTVR